MRYFLLLTTFILTAGCQPVEPKEVAATVFKYRYATMCTCCGGLEIQTGSDKYRTKTVPAPFATDTLPISKDSLNVWIRYKDDESECGRAMSNLIIITSMRLRQVKIMPLRQQIDT